MYENIQSKIFKQVLNYWYTKIFNQVSNYQRTKYYIKHVTINAQISNQVSNHQRTKILNRVLN